MPGVVNTASSNPYVLVGRTNQQLQAAIAVKPVVVSPNNQSQVWKQYTGGVITSTACSSNDGNTTGLAVGYGTDPTAGNYWIVQMSYGTQWGQQGYVWIGITPTFPGICDINSYSFYPNTVAVN